MYKYKLTYYNYLLNIFIAVSLQVRFKKTTSYLFFIRILRFYYYYAFLLNDGSSSGIYVIYSFSDQKNQIIQDNGKNVGETDSDKIEIFEVSERIYIIRI